MTTNCCECIHSEVCGLNDEFYEIQGMCQEADTKYYDFKCKHFKENRIKQAYREVNECDFRTLVDHNKEVYNQALEDVLNCVEWDGYTIEIKERIENLKK